MNRHIIVEQLREEWDHEGIDRIKFLNHNNIDIVQDGMDDLYWDELPVDIQKKLIDNRLGMIDFKEQETE